MKYGESTFDILYLLFAIITGIVILIKLRNKNDVLMGTAALVLGLGDAFHLIPRVLNYFIDADFTWYLGFGKLVTRNHLQLSAEVGYQNDFTRFYGFSDSTLHAVLAQPRDSIARSQYRMAYNTATSAVGVKTLNTDVNALGPMSVPPTFLPPMA